MMDTYLLLINCCNSPYDHTWQDLLTEPHPTFESAVEAAKEKAVYGDRFTYQLGNRLSVYKDSHQEWFEPVWDGLSRERFQIRRWMAELKPRINDINFI
jgi:hypothetical protein